VRVVSLLPAGTEVVAALGAGETLVGISHECDYPVEVTSLPRVTAGIVQRDASSAVIDATVRESVSSGTPVFVLDAELISSLAPTLILTQTLCDVCAVVDGDVRDVATLMSPAPVIIPLTGTTLAGVWNDVMRVARALGRDERGVELLAQLDARMRCVHDALEAARAPRPRVAVIEWLDPLFTAGHWTPDLVRRAGGIDVIAEPGAHSASVPVERFRDAAPELLLFAPCGFDVERAATEAYALLATDDWAWARDVEAWALDGNALTSRPGPRLADAVETIAAIVAPSLFGAPPRDYARKLSS